MPAEMVDRLQPLLSRAREVVFLCSGNMVRSAFADLYARHLGISVAVRSLATVYRNSAIFPVTAAALRKRGVSEAWIRGFRPTHVDDVLHQLDAESSVLFGMRRHHIEPRAARPALADRAFLLMEILGLDEEIADPVEEGADFERTFELVGRCVEELVARLGSRR